MKKGKIGLGYKCFIVLNQVQTEYPAGLRSLLQMAVPMKKSNTTASAAPTPHSRAIDGQEAEERGLKEQKINIILSITCSF